MTCTYSDEIMNAFEEYCNKNAILKSKEIDLYTLDITFNGITYQQRRIVHCKVNLASEFSYEPQFMRLFVDWYLNNKKP